MTKLAKRWLNEEDGFQVFEKFGLTQGGVLVALGVAAVVVVVMSNYWSNVGHQYFSTSTGIDGFLDPTNADSIGWTDNVETGWD